MESEIFSVTDFITKYKEIVERKGLSDLLKLKNRLISIRMKKITISFIIGLITGAILCCCYYNYMAFSGNIDEDKTYGFPELIYYSSQPLGVFGTFVAILVAIFGNEIKNMFFSPKCETYIEENGFKEELGHTALTSSPSAQIYKCTLVLKNTGSKELTDLSLVLKEVVYIDNNQKQKKISKFQNTLFWMNPSIKTINLRETEQRDIIIARVCPEASEGTPDNISKSPLRFSITGFNLDSKFNKKGIWVVKYCLQTPHKIIKTFEITLSWSGMWCNRITEMSKEVTCELKEISV